jgi:hypothetical protein
MLPCSREIEPVAITIRNQKTEELIRRIGRRTGEGPSAVVRRLAEREASINDNAKPVPPEIVKMRMQRLEELRLKHTHPDDPKLSWDEIEQEMDSIFGDELDFPREPRG